MNRAAIGRVGGRCSIPTKGHSPVARHRHSAINRAAIGRGPGAGGKCRIPAESHIPVPFHPYITVNRAAIDLVVGTARRIPAESHAHIVTQGYRTRRISMNRATVGR